MTIVDNIDRLKGEWVNIGMGEAVSNEWVAKALSYITEKPVKTIENYKEPESHSKVWVADNTKLKSLGWKPRFTFEEGLSRTWAYYEKRYTKS